VEAPVKSDPPAPARVGIGMRRFDGLEKLAGILAESGPDLPGLLRQRRQSPQATKQNDT